MTAVPTPGKTSIAIVVPVYNESQGIGQFFARCESALRPLAASYSFSFTIVNDGSTDDTLQKILALRPRYPFPVRVLDLSRNFGHANALTAGIHETDADAMVIMDADLQDPPEVIPELLQQFTQGKEVVYTVKTGREDSPFRRMAFKAFHMLFSKVTNLNIPEGSGSFSLMSRGFVREYRKLQESNKFIPGLRAYVGFPAGYVAYNKDKRFAGVSKQTLRKLLDLSFNAFFLFSNGTIRLTNLLFAAAVLLVLSDVFFRGWLPAYALPSLLAVIFAFQLWVIGIAVAKIQTEIAGRPPYIIQRTFEPDASTPPTSPRST